MPQYNLRQRARQNIIEKLDLDTLKGTYFFRDAYNMDVYFDDFDDKSGDYLRLDYDPTFNLHAGKNLIAIRGNSDTMEVGTELIIEAIDSTGEIVRTQIFDLNNDAHERVISVEIMPETVSGDVIVTIVGTATVAPNGQAIPQEWQGIPNFKWTRVFTAKPHMPNKSPITYSDTEKPQISIKEISKPFYKLHFNPSLSSSVGGWEGNPTASYELKTGVNTDCKVSYKKNGGKFFVTAHGGSGTNILDFGGFTKDMEGGLLIVRDPQEPRPSSVNGYSSAPHYAEDEIGDGLFEDVAYLGSSQTIPTMSFTPGAYMTTIFEVISPFEARTSEPHTTYQGTTATQYQEFEHFEFASSSFELIWSQMPQSYSADPTGSQGEEIRNSYAHVHFDNLEPLTGDVTRIKCYMKNWQAPFDWVLASDNAVETQELLIRRDYEKTRMPLGDFSQWGAGVDIDTLEKYWEVIGIGTNAPSMSIYSQGDSTENPPTNDNLLIGTNVQALELDGTAYWWLQAKESASFYEDQFYELSFKAVSVKTVSPTWTSISDQVILDPKLRIYMTGSAFTDGTDSLGKYIGKIEDISTRKKHVDYDKHDNDREIGYKFIFKADGTEFGQPCFKIESGIWHFWDISIKPWDRKGYTPGSWDVIFPTVKANVGNPDALDFKFEFYNDYGEISNYTAVINKVPWVNEYTTVFTHIHTNLLNITETASFNGVVEFNGAVELFTGSDGYLATHSAEDAAIAAQNYLTGSSYVVGTKDAFIITGSGGISTSFTTMSGTSSTKILTIDGNLAGGGSGNMNSFTASLIGGSSVTVSNGEVFSLGGDGGIQIVGPGSGPGASYLINNNGAAWRMRSQNNPSSYNSVGVGTPQAYVSINPFNDYFSNDNINIGDGGSGTSLSPYTWSIRLSGDTIRSKGHATWFANAGNAPILGYEVSRSGWADDERIIWPSGSLYLEAPVTVAPAGDNGKDNPAFGAGYYNWYGEKTYLQVNNWTREFLEPSKGVKYAAIFNTTAPPVPQTCSNCGSQDELSCGSNERSGHGIKIMTGTVPQGKDIADEVNMEGLPQQSDSSCGKMGALPGPIMGTSYLEPKSAGWATKTYMSNGLPNAYYISFYHWSMYGNMMNPCNWGEQIFAGGIRKDCQSYQNTIVIEYASDGRLKEEIEDTRWSIDDLMKIKVRDYWFTNQSGSHRTHKQTGFIAQELQEVYPQAARGDEYGDPKTNPMTVAPERLIPLLIKSVQDQQETIDNLSKRIKELEKE